MEVGEELYHAKMRVLGEMVKHYIKEEEDELFPELEAAKVDLNAVGKKISERKGKNWCRKCKPDEFLSRCA